MCTVVRAFTSLRRITDSARGFCKYLPFCYPSGQHYRGENWALQVPAILLVAWGVLNAADSGRRQRGKTGEKLAQWPVLSFLVLRQVVDSRCTLPAIHWEYNDV